MRQATLLLMLLLALPVFGASITDRLLVGLYAEPDASGEPLRLLKSGTPLESLERRGQFTLVRLGDNSEGWVESRYITDQKSARMQLLELQARYGAQRNRLRDAESLLVKLQRQPSPETGEAAAPTPSASTTTPLRPWLIPLVVALMLLSFLAGIAYRNYRLTRERRDGVS